jgi:L-fucose mutarotase
MASNLTAGEIPEVQQEVQAIVDEAAGRHWPMGDLERFAFYEAARNSYAVVFTGERRLFGNVLIKKGALPPES